MTFLRYISQVSGTTLTFVRFSDSDDLFVCGGGEQDASWLLPSSSPLKCTAPADVYMLLKSSDFVTHDLIEENVFAGCVPRSAAHPADELKYELELVLRKWYAVDRSRELRCFVRGGVFLGRLFLLGYEVD